MKFKVIEYYKDGRKRYRVKNVPSFLPVGLHTLEDGTGFNFDETYTIEAARNTADLIEQGEIRPAHVHHWNFHRTDGKPPDYDCRNFAWLDNFHVKFDAKKKKPIVYHDIFDLTWRDLNKLPMFAGRSMQILNPDTKKFDSLAFLPSLPPAAKGLGRIELDLSEVKPPDDDDPDKDLSFIDADENKIPTPETLAVFGEDFKYTKVVSVLFKEDVMPEDEKKKPNGEDADLENGDALDDTGETIVAPPEPKPEPETEPEPVYFEDLIDEFQSIADKLVEAVSAKIDGMKQEIINAITLSQAGSAQPAQQPPPQVPPQQPVGFSESAQNAYAAIFSEAVEKVQSRPRVEIGANGEELWDEAKPILEKLQNIKVDILSLQAKGKHAEAAAKFNEIDKLIDANVKPSVKRPPKAMLSSTDKKLLRAKFEEGLPKDLRHYPQVSEAWAEFNAGERVVDEERNLTRNPATFSEWKHGERTKLESFAMYYNNIFRKQKGISEVIPIEQVKKIERNN